MTDTATIIQTLLNEGHEEAAALIASLRRELAAAADDIERLNWLDTQREHDVQPDRNGDPEVVACYWTVYEQQDTVREAIDQARAR